MFEKKRRYILVLIAILFLSVLSIHSVEGEPTRTPSQPRNLTGSPRDASVILTWEEPATGSIGLIQYNVYRAAAGKPLEKMVVSPDIFSFTDRNLENGLEHNYYVTAENQLGEGAASNFVQITPDGDPPNVSITSPTEGAVFVDGIILISWSGTDPTSDILEYHIRFGEDLWIKTGLNTDYEMTDPIQGVNLIEVRATDIALNKGFDKINITIDNRAPTVVIRSPLDHEYLKSSRIDLEWDTYERESSIAGYEVFLDGKYTGYRGEGENYTIRNVKDGDYNVEVLAYDIVGNTGRDSVNVTVDTNGPILYMYEPEQDLITNSSMVKFNWTGDDLSGIETYSIYHKDMGWMDQGFNTEVSIGPFPEGLNLIKLRAVDLVGWSTEVERTVMVDLTEPDIQIEHPVEGQWYSDSRLTVKWNGTDDLTGIESFYFRLDSGKWEKDIDLKYTLKDLRTGTYVISVKAVDEAGNEKIATTMFHVDNDPPTVIEYGPIGSGILLPDRIWMKFNEEMDILRFNVSDLTGRTKMIDDFHTWTPDNRFEYGESYFVMISGTDRTGNELEYFAWTFTITDQVMIRGVVYDNANGDPIKEARIILNSGMTTFTNPDGSFNFTVGMGNRTILIKKSGYETNILKLNLTPNREGYVGNVYLEKSQDPIGKRVTSALFDPWTAIVLALVLVVLALIVFLFKEKILFAFKKVKREGEIEVHVKDH